MHGGLHIKDCKKPQPPHQNSTTNLNTMMYMMPSQHAQLGVLTLPGPQAGLEGQAVKACCMDLGRVEDSTWVHLA